MNILKYCCNTIVLYIILACSIASAKPVKPDIIKNAIAVLTPAPNYTVQGVIIFEQISCAGYGRLPQVRISINVSGLTPGDHGFHVHTYGDISQPCGSAGGKPIAHYNPFNKTHGGPLDKIRHAGDLGNIVANQDGVVIAVIESSLVTLNGPYSVIGRSINVHLTRDDFGKGTGALEATSKISGNSGPSIACGVIGRENTEIPH